MKLLVIFLALFCAIFFVTAGYICWLNRADMALYARIFSALFVGSAAAFAAAVFSLKSEKLDKKTILAKILSALLVGFAAAAGAGVFSLKAEKQEVSFSSIFVFNTETDMPLNSYRDSRVNPLASCPNASLIRNMLAQLDTMRNNKAEHRNRKPEHTSYYDIITALIIGDLLLLYSEGWDINLTVADSEVLGRSVTCRPSPTPGATIVTRQEFSPLFDEPRLLETLPLAAWDRKIKLPPATKMVLNRDYTGQTITLTNTYARVRITIALSSIMPGMGALSKWVKIPEEEQEKYTSVVFRVTVTAEYAYWRSGHPEMPVYKKWVNTMTEYLRSDLSSAAWEDRLKPSPRDYVPEGT